MGSIGSHGNFDPAAQAGRVHDSGALFAEFLMIRKPDIMLWIVQKITSRF
jgi:hypothetical protein